MTRADPGRAAMPGGDLHSLLVVTDLDGTLLDERTYDFAPAVPALAALVERAAIVVLASSKTREEMEQLAVRLRTRGPLIAENGSLLLIPRAEGGYEALALGVPRPELVVALGEIALEARTEVRGFSSMALAEIRARTGLAEAAARAAARREQDEPFLLADPEALGRVSRAARRRGLQVSRGGRFFHLTGPVDKGRALCILLSRIGESVGERRTIGLGDAANDLELLRAVERPIVVPGPDGAVRPELRVLRNAEVAPAPGPEGWNAAILAVLSGRRLPAVGEESPG